MAEGLIQQSQDNDQLEDLGGEYFRDLLSRSIFQSSHSNSSKFVMHDLINDLAQLVSGKVSFRLEDEMGFNNQSKLFERTRYSSYICHECNCKGGFEVFNNAEHVRTFLPLLPINDRVSTYYIINTVVFNLLMKFKKLRVLSLRKHYIVELPNSLGRLRLLRYLNLSDTMIRCLPKSINSMSNLQTLILRNCCRLLKLPSNFGNLINLRHLDIFGATLIAGMPLGMGNLRCLRTLSNFIVGKSFGSSLKDLKHLQFLRGELRVSRLDNVIDFQGTREVILSDKKDLKMLLLEWSCKFDDLRDEHAEENLLDRLQPHENLKELTIRCYAGKIFPSWLGDSSLIFNMVVIRLEGCEKCTSLPSLGQLGSLKNLTIKGMKGIKSIGSEFYGEGCSYPFKSLETLYFEDLQE
ncbi:hypothetical protein Dsin_000904 [Dipteronia sinensis]|uniref:Uncharacterized protein n=1 Tax=Dipteronia sinensis TaxID=43782 RepID=A0AAE0B3R7_9ROSI|nr:hypothetical protein Dsin_000904 [Dipteronia sinensis]